MALTKCVLEKDKTCIECGQCNVCDLDDLKICDNCEECIRINADYKKIDIIDMTKEEE